MARLVYGDFKRADLLNPRDMIELGSQIFTVITVDIISINPAFPDSVFLQLESNKDRSAATLHSEMHVQMVEQEREVYRSNQLEDLRQRLARFRRK